MHFFFSYSFLLVCEVRLWDTHSKNVPGWQLRRAGSRQLGLPVHLNSWRSAPSCGGGLFWPPYSWGNKTGKDTNHTIKQVVVLRLVEYGDLLCPHSTCLISTPWSPRKGWRWWDIQRATFPLWFPRGSHHLIPSWNCHYSFSLSCELMLCPHQCPGDVGFI